MIKIYKVIRMSNNPVFTQDTCCSFTLLNIKQELACWCGQWLDQSSSYDSHIIYMKTNYKFIIEFLNLTHKL